MVDIALQRKNMVESQVRPSDVTDRRVMRAMLDLPREAFCPPALAATAYRDEVLQVNEGKGAAARFTMAPRALAKMIQALDLGARDSVLEIGAATGYASAILARIAAKVTALEVDAGLAASARKALEQVGATNVTVVEGALAGGHAAGAPYDAIMIGGSVPQVPRAILDQLKDGGRLVVVVADGRFGRLTRWRRIGSTFDSHVVGDAAAPAMPGFEKAKEFVF
jgi:protein-L-isoaspartate(D-aspartate) O-methyltransferase